MPLTAPHAHMNTYTTAQVQEMHKGLQYLSDVVDAIRRGNVPAYIYMGNVYHVTRHAYGWTITAQDSGTSAFLPTITNSMDLHGSAAFLAGKADGNAYKFDREGNATLSA